jgi:hypothetical protein
VGGKNPAVAEHAAAGFGPLDRIAVQPHPHPLPLDAAPQPAQLLGLEPPERGHVADPGAGEACRIAPGDAGNVREPEREQGTGQVAGMERHEAVGLPHLGGDLGQQVVRPQAHRAGEGRADPGSGGILDALPDREGLRPFRRRHRADHLIDGADRLDGKHRLDGVQDLAMQLHIGLVPRRHEDDAGTLPAGIAHEGAALDPQDLRLPADRDEPRMLRLDRNDADRPAAQIGPEVLLGAGEEGIEVDIEPLQTRRFAHRCRPIPLRMNKGRTRAWRQVEGRVCG